MNLTILVGIQQEYILYYTTTAHFGAVKVNSLNTLNKKSLENPSFLSGLKQLNNF